MASRVVMPKLTDTMEEGVVVAWKKHEGDPIAAGDVLAEIETDKAVMDLEAFASGTVRRLLVAEGETVEAGALIAVIAEPDEDISAALEAAPAAAPRAPAAHAETRKQPAAQPATGSPVKASPRAKKLAAERGVDLTSLAGSGPGGRVVEEDVQAALEKSAASAAAGPAAGRAGDRPLSQMRKAIARAMVQSKAPVPHFYLTSDIAMDEAEQWRLRLKQGRQDNVPVPGMTHLMIKAAAMALLRHPEVNVSFAGEALRYHPMIDIGIAVALDDGLITPVLRGCGEKTLEAIAVETRALIERAREKRLAPQEYSGATFSISNLGMYDVESFIAVLLPPEAAALAIGAIRDVPVVRQGTVTVGRRMKVTLSCDHRALDGAQGAKFLREFKRVLEHPSELTAGDQQ